MKKLLMIVLIATTHSFGAELPSVTIRLYNYAEVKVKTLEASKKETSRIFRQAGVELRWVDCPTSRDEIADYPDCISSWREDEFMMRLLPDSMVAKLDAGPDSTLGTSPGYDPGPCSAASVYYGRVASRADGPMASISTLLARAMTHEIGHVLLGHNAHSRNGIMRGMWSGHEFTLAATPEMIFTPEQSLRMKVRLGKGEVASVAAQGVY